MSTPPSAPQSHPWLAAAENIPRPGTNPWLLPGARIQAVMQGPFAPRPAVQAPEVIDAAPHTPKPRIVYNHQSPGLTPDHPAVDAIIAAKDGLVVSLELEDALGELDGRDHTGTIDLGPADTLTAKETALWILQAEMILPGSSPSAVLTATTEQLEAAGLVEQGQGELTRAGVSAIGALVLNLDYFGRGRRNTLLEGLQSDHESRHMLGGGHYGSVPVVMHETMHRLILAPEPPMPKDDLRPDKPSKTAVSMSAGDGVNTVAGTWRVGQALPGATDPVIVTKGADAHKSPPDALWTLHFWMMRNSPHAFNQLGLYAGRNVEERWAEGGRLAVDYASMAPDEAKEIWSDVVPMNPERWAALDRQSANFRRTVARLYAETDPGTGEQLSPNDIQHRTAMIRATAGYGRPVLPNGLNTPLSPVVHGVNVLPQKERDKTKHLHSWVGTGRSMQVDVF